MADGVKLSEYEMGEEAGYAKGYGEGLAEGIRLTNQKWKDANTFKSLYLVQGFADALKDDSGC